MGGRFRPDGLGMAHWGMGLLGLLFLLALLALAVAGAVLLVRLLRQRRAAATGAATGPAGVAPAASLPPNPLAVLDDRLARGDIDVADYEVRRRALTGGGAPSASETRVDPLA